MKFYDTLVYRLLLAIGSNPFRSTIKFSDGMTK